MTLYRQRTSGLEMSLECAQRISFCVLEHDARCYSVSHLHKRCPIFGVLLFLRTLGRAASGVVTLSDKLFRSSRAVIVDVLHQRRQTLDVLHQRRQKLDVLHQRAPEPKWRGGLLDKAALLTLTLKPLFEDHRVRGRDM